MLAVENELLFLKRSAFLLAKRVFDYIYRYSLLTTNKGRPKQAAFRCTLCSHNRLI